MKKIMLAVLALSSNAFAGAYDDYVQAVKDQRPSDQEKIDQVASLTNDMVIHYEPAVTIGTTSEYKERAKISHFNSFLDAADKKCGDIDLSACISQLVCENKIQHNLNTQIMPCK